MTKIPEIFVWQWGRYGSGPRIAFELVQALRQYHGGNPVLSLAQDAEILTSTTCRNAVDFPLKTYQNAGQFALRTVFMRKVLRPLLGFLEEKRPDAALSIMPGYWDLFLIRHLRHLGIPLAIIVHDAKNHPGDRFVPIQWMQKSMIGHSSTIITLSDYVASCLHEQNLLENKSHHTISHPVLAFDDLQLPPPRPSVHSPGKPLRILLTGRLRKYKGIELFLKAISQIDPTRLNVRIAGSVNDNNLLARAKNLANLDVRSGWLSEQQLVSHIDWSDLVILPYTEASQSGLIPTVYGRHRPVIATPVGGLPEQVKHEETGLVTGDISSNAIAQAISRFLNNPDLLQSCGENAFQCAKTELSWKQTGGKFANAVYEAIPAGTRGN